MSQQYYNEIAYLCLSLSPLHVCCLFVCLQPFAFDPPEGFTPIQEAESEHLVQAAGELLG